MSAPGRRDDRPGLPAVVAFPEDRLPPQNIEAEQGVIGAALIDDATIDETWLIVKPRDFWRDDHQILWREILAIRSEGKPLDAIILDEQLRRIGLSERVGGADTISELINRVPHAANAKFHAEIVRQKSVLRDLIAAAQETIQEGYSNNFTADELLESAERRVFAINDSQATGRTDSMHSLAREAMDRIERRGQGDVQGLPTGLSDYDAMTDGLAPEQLIIVAGRPSMGKSTLGLNMAENLALDGGASVLYVTLEMAGRELAERTLSSRSKVEGWKLRKGRVAQAEWEKLGRTVDGLRNIRLFVDSSPSRSLFEVAANARRTRARHGLDALFIDYLQLLKPHGTGRESRQEQVADMARTMKQVARDLKVPVIALSQLNRNCEGREDRRPLMSDLRESGEIEQSADVVILMHRPDYYKPDDRPGVAELIIAKNRNGQTGTVDLVFLKEVMRFENHIVM